MAGTVHELEQKDLFWQVQSEAARAAQQLIDEAHLRQGQIVVVGCSTSEVVGRRVGSWSTPEIAQAIFSGLNGVFAPQGIYIAAQCCEHLNRAIIVEKAYAKENRIPIVNVVPQLKAGGSFATAAYAEMKEPVAIEYIQAQAGIDIGDTLIGMHLAPVAVPVRSEHSMVGGAHVVMARTRAKYIGGIRAGYREGI